MRKTVARVSYDGAGGSFFIPDKGLQEYLTAHGIASREITDTGERRNTIQLSPEQLRELYGHRVNVASDKILFYDVSLVL